MEKIEFTKEQIEKIAEGISVICFKRVPKTNKYVLWEYPKPKDVFGDSCIWEEPLYNKEHPKVAISLLPSFEAVHTYGSPSLFKPSLAEVIRACPLKYFGNFNAVTIQYNDFTDDGSKHKSIVTPYVICKKKKPFVYCFSEEDENMLHPSPLKIGDLVGTIIDEFCQVSIDTIQPDTRNLQMLFEGPLNEVPEKYLDKRFRPIEIIKDSEYKIHLIIN
nr:MAG TPA: hypothetical protein [Caudoviricetes sp.]